MNRIQQSFTSNTLNTLNTTKILMYVLSAISVLGYIFVYISPLTFSGYVIITTTTLFSMLVVFQEINMSLSEENKTVKLLKMMIPLVLLFISLGTVLFINGRYHDQLKNIDRIGMFKTLHTIVKTLIVVNSIAFTQ